MAFMILVAINSMGNRHLLSLKMLHCQNNEAYIDVLNRQSPTSSKQQQLCLQSSIIHYLFGYSSASEDRVSASGEEGASAPEEEATVPSSSASSLASSPFFDARW